MEVYCSNCGNEECRFNPCFSTYKCTECGCEFDNEELTEFDNECFEEKFSDSWDEGYEFESKEYYANIYDE